jgi:hypothetical protein
MGSRKSKPGALANDSATANEKKKARVNIREQRKAKRANLRAIQVEQQNTRKKHK